MTGERPRQRPNAYASWQAAREAAQAQADETGTRRWIRPLGTGEWTVLKGPNYQQGTETIHPRPPSRPTGRG